MANYITGAMANCCGGNGINIKDSEVKEVLRILESGIGGVDLLNALQHYVSGKGIELDHKNFFVIKEWIPYDKEQVTYNDPKILPTNRVEVGDCLLGKNGCVGKVSLVNKSDDDTFSITIIGLETQIDIGDVAHLVQDVAVVSDTEPTDPTTRIWVDTSTEEIAVPTLDQLVHYINDSNRQSTLQFPSVKAVCDYIDQKVNN